MVWQRSFEDGKLPFDRCSSGSRSPGFQHHRPVRGDVAASGLSYGDDWWALLISGLVFTLVNFFLKPVLAILSIPFIIVTLGIFYS